MPILYQTCSENRHFVLIADMSSLTLEDIDSVSEADHRDRDTLAPLPPPVWNNQYSTNPYGPSYPPPPPMNYAAPPMSMPPYTNTFANESASYVSMPGNATSCVESAHSGSGKPGL